MNYGLLLADLKPRDGESICLVRGLQSTQSGNGFDCPVLKMSHIIFSIPSLHIMKSVSVLHECGPTCKFVQKTTNRTVKRAAISCTKIEYEHLTINEILIQDETNLLWVAIGWVAIG